MHSQVPLDYLRSGTIAPSSKSDTKSDVEAKLEAPDDWKGRISGFGWDGPLLTDFRQSWAWHCGSVCIAFPDARLSGLPVGGVKDAWVVRRFDHDAGIEQPDNADPGKMVSSHPTDVKEVVPRLGLEPRTN